VTWKVIHWLQALSNRILRTVLQQLANFNWQCVMRSSAISHSLRTVNSFIPSRSGRNIYKLSNLSIPFRFPINKSASTLGPWITAWRCPLCSRAPAAYCRPIGLSIDSRWAPLLLIDRYLPRRANYRLSTGQTKRTPYSYTLTDKQAASINNGVHPEN